jgi:hypothetical protein
MLSDYLQPRPQPPNENTPFSAFPVYTGPTTPAFSTDDQGNCGCRHAARHELLRRSQRGRRRGEFHDGRARRRNAGFPPSSGNVANEIPLHGTLGLAQAQSVLVSDPDSNPVFYYDQ